MKPRTVVITLAAIALLLVLAYTVRAGGGGTIARWVGSIHGGGGH